MLRKIFYQVVIVMTCMCFAPFRVRADSEAESSDQTRIRQYVNFIQAYSDSLGPIGNHQKGEIEIILDSDQILEIEKSYKKKLIRRGVEPEVAALWSTVGVFEGDSNWVWIRDAVILPSGRKTIAGRLNWKTGLDGPQGVAMLPVMKDKRILVCLKYKHALRSWSIELPKGNRLYGESALDAARRELRNETGFNTLEEHFLGSISIDSTVINSQMPVFLGHINSPTAQSKDDEKAVLGFLFLTKEEIKKAFHKGYLTLKVHGSLEKIQVNDACLAYSLLQAELRNLI